MRVNFREWRETNRWLALSQGFDFRFSYGLVKDEYDLAATYAVVIRDWPPVQRWE